MSQKKKRKNRKIKIYGIKNIFLGHFELFWHDSCFEHENNSCLSVGSSFKKFEGKRAKNINCPFQNNFYFHRYSFFLLSKDIWPSCLYWSFIITQAAWEPNDRQLRKKIYSYHTNWENHIISFLQACLWCGSEQFLESLS